MQVWEKAVAQGPSWKVEGQGRTGVVVCSRSNGNSHTTRAFLPPELQTADERNLREAEMHEIASASAATYSPAR
jgi:uncharacterized protein YodC (DUF2158 family)